MGGRMKAVLIGPIQQENLALGYLAAYARAKGHEVAVVAYAYRKDLDRTVERALAEQPDLIGLGIAFQNNVDDYVLLVRTLRERGFRGHLTCGGHVGTFCWEELLAELPELDTVVRHDGEETLVEMLEAIARGESPRSIAGLVWREGDRVVKGPVRPAFGDLDALPRPERSPEPYVVGGMTVDFLISARGCVGECSYCSIAAYTSEQRKSYRLRAPEAVADEIAFAYHERGAKVFFVQDDLFVLPGERAAITRMERIKSAIRERGVGDVVFWIKGRPENISLPVAQAAREMGAIHMFLGVENASSKRLKYLGRTHLPIHNDSAIDNCRAAGIVPSFNFMLFDPDCTLDDVGTTLDMADRNLDLPWNVCRTEIYSGTALRERLATEGRLEGNWRSFGYRMRDERAEVMFRILRVSLNERALAIDSLLNRLISLSFARQLHAHFFPSRATSALDEAVTKLGIEARRDTVARLRELRDLVANAPLRDARAMQRFAVEQGLAIGAFDMPLRERTEALWNQLHARGRVQTHRQGNAQVRSRGGFEVAAGS
ncbi:Fe-S oxidoreductase [Labilithrix luteola]|uniref:Fe-S oxidoreductase n=2 Tax=Labilithrix luteola TaxID=1391654 RepID=A0A0K1PJB8_9BACT|nr:Fe-S oxidoreductase [Labilithrix luteola]